MEKPVIVGVITPYERTFRMWLDLNHKEGEKYIRISCYDSLIGHEFNRIELGLQYWLVDAETVDAAKLRIR